MSTPRSEPPAGDAGQLARTLERAKRYPYAGPATSLVLAGGRSRPRERSEDLTPAVLGERIALLAYGANRSEEALAGKAADPALAADPLIVLRAGLRDFDVVYSAHVSPYGAIGATLQASPGTEVEVALLLVTAGQLEAMTATEPNYRLETLRGLDLRLVDAAAASLPGGELQAYLSRHGCLAHQGSEVALTAVAARERRLPSLSQPQALALAAARLGRAGDVDGLILEAAADPRQAAAHTAVLRRDALALRLPESASSEQAGHRRHART